MPAEVTAIPVSAPLPTPGSASADVGSPSAGSDFDGYFSAEVSSSTAKEPQAGEGKPAAAPVKEVPIRPEAAGSGKKNEPAPVKPEPSKDNNGTAPKGDKTVPGDKAAAATGTADKKPRETPWQIIHRLEKRVSDFEREKDTWSKQTNGEHPELKTLRETTAAKDKRITDLETKLNFADYSQSDEYNTRYETPFVNAYMAGRAKTASVNVNNGEGMRKGTAEDFDTLMGISNEDQAADAAVEMFGSKAPLVLYHRERVMELNAAKNKALEEYRTKGSEHQKVTKEQFEAQYKEISGQIEGYWKKHVDAAWDKYPQFSRPIDGDETHKKLLEDGKKLSDEAFSILNPFDPKLSPQQRERTVQLHGVAKNSMAWFKGAVYRLNKADARVKELEAKLAEYEASEPAAGTGKRGKEKGVTSWEDELEAKYAK